ncbi:TonB-dependent receptor [Pseudoduganella umbonata]|uniref:Iron complex outermembrane receptor protein n=1 Tax=Pseudoduganella umbonata TaxID=864828 RepID=A0A4V1EE72_9BURK|nr:TonB-dependent receptor [Pseudoduganella umbonata]MBB3223557.1 iron complex outermembrane receptor protein [Pseudoduganella umbonata]QCP13571.1 TonB-dependent receptor [Pseudoduganella umbonata]
MMANKTVLVRSLALAFGAVAALPALPSRAQDTVRSTAEQQPMQRVTVTGSLISRADKETPSPIQVLTAADIARSGQTSIAEVLSNLSANGQGALGTGFAGAFAAGGSGVSLRGLSVGLTLVLVDGHRMSPYPLSDDSQRQFVDVSSIPFDAVERIEVLKEGASALYGSDAVAGVVNIILKKEFKGFSASAEAGNSQHGGGKMHKVTATGGIGDLDTDGYNAYVSAEYRHADPIRVHQREQYGWASGDWTTRGGLSVLRGVPNESNSFLTAASSPFLYNPATGVNNPASYQFLDPNCNFLKYRAGQCVVRDEVSNLQPESDRLSVLAGFTKKLGEDWTLALKASMFRRESTNGRGLTNAVAFTPSNTFGGYTALVPGQAPRIVNGVPDTRLPAGGINQLGAPARLYGLIPGAGSAAQQNNESTATRFAADLNGTWGGWDIGAAAGYSKVKTESVYNGYVNRVALYDALRRAGNPYNPLGGNSVADNAAIVPTFGNEAESELTFAEAHAQRELVRLPGGGPLTFAAGVSWYKKELNAPPPDLLAQGVVGNGAAYVFGDETNTAAFAELNALPLQNLELSASARYDHYDTYGNSFTPGAKFKWKAHPALTVRGTFARGFRAPNAAESGISSSTFSFNAIDDPILCADGDRTTAGNVPSACAFVPAFVQTTNPDLEPEKSKSFTLGLIVEPVRNLSATLDYYSIEVKNQINTESGLPDFVPVYVRNPAVPIDIADGNGGLVTGVPPVGTIAYAQSSYVNSGGVKTIGVELDLSYRWNAGDIGNFRSQLSFNHMISYKLDQVGIEYELAGTHGPSVVSGNTGNPKNRAQLTLGYEKGPVTLTSTFNWVGSYNGLDPSLGVNDCADIAVSVGGRAYFNNNPNGTPPEYCKIRSFMSTDLNAVFRVNKNLTIKASILNAFDRQPPIDVATYGNAGPQTAYNATLHQAGAVGRYFSLGASYTF